MDKPTGNQTINENCSGDTTPSRGGNNSSSCGSNNDIDLGCGLTSSSTKLVSGSTTPQASPPSTTKTTTTTTTTKTTIPLPLGAPLPNAAAASSTSTSTASSSTLQQTTMPRFVSNGASNMQHQPINLSISTTTGGNFEVTVDPNISMENLKKIIAKKLKVSKDRIRLLHRERELQDGSLKDNNLMDGSKIILIPNVETGLLAQRPENTVMQALESLNDSQVNDFLSGKTPLNLSMRLGDHMMLIQLQLSTVNPANGTAAGHNGNGSSCGSARARSSSQRTTRTGSVSGTSTLSNHHTHHHHHHHHHHRSNGQGSTSPSGHVTMAGSSGSVPITMLRKVNGDATTSEAVNRLKVGSGTTNLSPLTATSTSSVIKSSDLSSFLSKRDYESLQNIVKSIAMTQPARLASAMNINALSAQTLNTTSQVTNGQSLRTATMVPTKTNNFPASHSEAAILEQSPIKSLSNLVSSSPIETTTIKNIPTSHGGSSSSSNSNGSSSSILVSPTAATTGSTINAPPTVSSMLSCQDPIAAKLTSCLCTRLNPSNGVGAVKNCIESSCISRQDVSLSSNGVVAQRPAMLATSTPSKIVGTTTANSPLSSASMLHKTANNPIVRSKHRHHHHHHHHHHHYHHNNGAGGGNASLIVRPKQPNILSRSVSVPSTASSASNDSGFASDDSMLTSTSKLNGTGASTAPAATTQATTNGRTSSHSIELDDSGIMTTDTRTLAEASRNLTQTLRKLSKEVFTNKIDLSSSDDTSRKGGSGAVIESMKNHGKGIYSGTFSGTLNPALQDRYGRPKRDISTVIHILNDLLSATPQYSRGARISFESPSSSGASTNAGTNIAAIANSSRNKQLQVKHAHSHSQSCVKCIKAQTLFGQHSNNSSSSNNSNTNTANTSNNTSANCAYGECNGHYTTNNNGSSKNVIRTSNYACCSNVSNNGNNINGSNSNSTDPSHIATNDRNVCGCRFRNNASGNDDSTEREREHTCQKCLSEMEMLRTKSKLDQLRLVMQQRKQKREARKLKGAPYGARVVGATSPTTNNIGSTEISESTKSATTVAAAAAVATSTVDAASLKNASKSNSTTLTSAPPSEVSPNHIVEEVDTAA